MYHKKMSGLTNIRIKLVMCMLLLASLLVMNIASVSAVDSWYDSDWTYRKSITIPNSNVDADLVDFPLLVDILDSDLVTKAQSDGDDIVFTDSSATKLSHEIELWDNSTGKLIAWVKVPSLSSSVDTTIYMYYGNDAVGSQENQSSVWSSNYAMVLHLDETSGTHVDSTLKGNDGTVAGGVNQSATGTIDGAVGLLGVNGYIGVTHSEDITGFTNAFTASCWVRTDNVTRDQYILNKYDPTNNSRAWYIAYRNWQDSIAFTASADGSNTSTSTWIFDFIPTLNQWYYVTVVWESNTIPSLYLNGTSMSVGGGSTIGSIYNNNLTNLSLGRYYQFYNLDGVLDEVRIADIARSSEWIAAEYLNQITPSSFYTLGAESTGQEISITASAGTGGSISPEGVISVTEGSDITFYIKNDEGYAVLDVIVDSFSVGPSYTYTFNAVSDNHTIEAQFESVSPPTISLDKSTYYKEDVVRVTVNGGTAEKPVLLQIKNPSGTVVWADQDNFGLTGNYVHEFKIPTSWPYGSFTVHVKDSDSGAVRSTSLIVSSPYVPPPIIPPYIPPNEDPISIAGPNQTSYVDRDLFFNGSQSYDPDGEIDTYLWIFGDGVTSLENIASHSYSEAGEYVVELIVIDLSGNTGSSNFTVNVLDVPLIPTDGSDTGLGANQTDTIIDSIESMGTSIKLNTSDQVTVSIFKYPSNPYPNATLPANSLMTFIDIFVSAPGSIDWPIYVERHYSDSEIEGLIEEKLGLYYYDDGEWHLCRETGVYLDLNVVWANMYEEEVYGSPVVLAERPQPATFVLSQLNISPSTVMPEEPVNVTINIVNIGEEAGSYNVTLMVNEEVEELRNIYLNSTESQFVSFSLNRSIDNKYTVSIGNLTGMFTVYTPTPAEFILSGFDLTSTTVSPGEYVQGTIQITNIGETRGIYNLTISMDLIDVLSDYVNLSGGESTIVTFAVVSEVKGLHSVQIESETLSFTVSHPAEFTISDFILLSSKVEPGVPIQGSIKVTNVGGTSGVYNLDVSVGMDVVYSEAVNLSDGESRFVTFEVSSNVEGLHSVQIEDETLSFTVAHIFTLTDLSLEKTEVEIGETLQGSITIINYGEVTGTYALELHYDAAVIFTSNPEIVGGEEKTVTFDIPTDDVGSHKITAEELEISFTVKEAPQSNQALIYLGVLAIVIAIIYYAWRTGLLDNLLN